eukprot:8916144-Alexandrium_andersonii.AAC.1
MQHEDYLTPHVLSEPVQEPLQDCQGEVPRWQGGQGRRLLACYAGQSALGRPPCAGQGRYSAKSPALGFAWGWGSCVWNREEVEQVVRGSELAVHAGIWAHARS